MTSDSKTPQTYTEQIQSTVSSAYQSLPTLSGVAAAVGLGSLVGGTESTNADTQVAQDQDQTSKENDVNETETEQTNDGDDRSLKERARAESLAAGRECRRGSSRRDFSYQKPGEFPSYSKLTSFLSLLSLLSPFSLTASCQSRVGKDQTAIGTETVSRV